MNNQNSVQTDDTNTKALLNVINDVARTQREDFSARSFIAQVKERLRGTHYEEKREFENVAKLCGRTLRDLRLSGYVSHTEVGTYHIERDMTKWKR